MFPVIQFNARWVRRYNEDFTSSCGLWFITPGITGCTLSRGAQECVGGEVGIVIAAGRGGSGFGCIGGGEGSSAL
jgi:hypothetical protein